MPERLSSLSRFLLLLALYMVAVTAAFFGLSSYYFNDTNLSANYSALTAVLEEEAELLDRYQAGWLSRAELQRAVNPALNTDSAFYMLLDEDKHVLAYTESAAPYFAGSTLPNLLDALDLAMQMRGIPVEHIRMPIDAARIITEMAGRLTEGEMVTLPENLPGKDMREIAGALNYMCRTVTRAIGDLKYEKETMSLILEGLNEGILAVDEEGKILHENAAAWQLLGGEETDAYRAVMACLLEKHEEDHWEQKCAFGGRMLYFAASRLPQDEKTGKSRGAVALIRDITEQERLERTRHDYVANISHELRTPLASIRGLGEGLRDGLVTDEADQKRYYGIIVQEVTRLSRLVNDMLELSSLQSNPAAFEMERVDPNELIYDLHDRNGSLFTEKHIAFERSLPNDPLPDIRSNEDRLSQVLTIFLDNARKYTPEGGKVTLGAEQTEKGIRFFVRDTGIGMDEETQRLAFDRFHQAERGRSDKGSGLGLSIAKEVLQKMGVVIRVKSAPGEGSEFSFTIANEEKA